MPTTTPTFWSLQKTISNSTTAFGSSIAALSEGGFAIVFEQTAGTGERDIIGRLYSHLGDVTGGNFLSVVTASAADITSPEAVQLGNGDLAVSYVSEFSSTDHDIRVAIRSGPGFTSGSSFGFIDGSANDDFFVHETEQTLDGNFVTLWQRDDGVLNNGNDPIIFQRVDAAGNPLGGQVVVDATSTESQSNGDLTVLGNGNLVVVWHTFNFTTLTTTLLMRVFNAFGTPISGEIAFAATPNPAFPVVEALNNGNYVVAWQDVSHSGIYHRVFDENGDPVSIRHFYSGGFSILPKLTELKDGGYLLAWSDFAGTEGDGSPDGSITIQRFDAVGNIVGRPLIIDNPGDQTLEDIQTLSDGRVVVTFINETGDSTNVTKLALQIIDPRDSVIDGTPFADNIVARLDDTRISGFEGNDTLTGMRGDDTLLGGTDADRLLGGVGDDTLHGGSGNDILNGYTQDDVVRGGSGNDILFGTLGSDTLFGNSGKDVIVGGADADVLWGGTGLDRFDYNAINESGTTLATEDLINDFVQGDDRIDVRTIDAKQSTVGNQDFVFIGGAAFSAEGQVRFVQAGGDTFVQINTLGAGGAESIIHLDGLFTLVAGDLIL